MATKKAAGTDNVTVACKLPSGLTIHLGDRRVLKLHGAQSPYAIAGHGMTRNVPLADWQTVQALHADAAWLRNEFVFMMRDPQDASDKAAEREDVAIGFEPIDPKKLAGEGVNGRIIQAD